MTMPVTFLNSYYTGNPLRIYLSLHTFIKLVISRCVSGAESKPQREFSTLFACQATSPLQLGLCTSTERLFF